MKENVVHQIVHQDIPFTVDILEEDENEPMLVCIFTVKIMILIDEVNENEGHLENVLFKQNQPSDEANEMHFEHKCELNLDVEQMDEANFHINT